MRPFLPWKVVDYQAVGGPIKPWLVDWLPYARFAKDGIPEFTVFCNPGHSSVNYKYIFFKGYKPRHGKVSFSW